MNRETNNRSYARQEEEEMERAFRKTSAPQQRASNNKKKSNNRKPIVIAICIAVVAVLTGIIAGISFFSGGDNNGLIYDNITVAGVDVGGLSKTDAISAVRLATADTYTVKNMVICVLDAKKELSPVESGAKLDVVAAVNAAYNYGRTGSHSRQQKEQLIAMTTGYTVDITPFLSLKTDVIKAAVNELGIKYSSTLSQTSYKITEDASGNKVLVLTMGTPEYVLDLNALYGLVMQAYNTNVFSVEGACITTEPDVLDLQEIYDKHCIAPVNASFAPNTFEVIEEIYGYGFVIKDVQSKMKNAKYGEVLQIPFAKTAPEITAELLTTTLYKDALGSFTARSGSEANRDTNLRLACEAINGLVLKPGDVFSFNDALGERTTAKGYKPGPSYSGNNTVYSVGGGICQVSTALYYCTLIADLEIITRDNHGFLPSYAVYGMDAVVNWGTLDFMFKNNTNYPIRIQATADGGVVTVELIGTDEKDYYIEMDYKILNTYKYDITYKEMSASNPDGYKDGDYIVDPYTGYDVESYKNKYDKTTKALLAKNLVATSNYRKRDAVICKIIDSTPSTPSDPTTPSVPNGNGGVSDGPGELPDDLLP